LSNQSTIYLNPLILPGPFLTFFLISPNTPAVGCVMMTGTPWLRLGCDDTIGTCDDRIGRCVASLGNGGWLTRRLGSG